MEDFKTTCNYEKKKDIITKICKITSILLLAFELSNTQNRKEKKTLKFHFGKQINNLVY